MLPPQDEWHFSDYSKFSIEGASPYIRTPLNNVYRPRSGEIMYLVASVRLFVCLFVCVCPCACNQWAYADNRADAVDPRYDGLNACAEFWFSLQSANRQTHTQTHGCYQKYYIFR